MFFFLLLPSSLEVIYFLFHHHLSHQSSCNMRDPSLRTLPAPLPTSTPPLVLWGSPRSHPEPRRLWFPGPPSGRGGGAGAPTCSAAARCPGAVGPAPSGGCGPGCSGTRADSAVPTPAACWLAGRLSDASRPAPACPVTRREGGREGGRKRRWRGRNRWQQKSRSEFICFFWVFFPARVASYRTSASGLPSWLLGMQFSTGSFWLFPAPFCLRSFLPPDDTLPLEALWFRGEELETPPPFL